MAESPNTSAGSPMDWEPDTSPVVFNQQYIPFPLTVRTNGNSREQASSFNPPTRRTFSQFADGTEPMDRQAEAAQAALQATPQASTQFPRHASKKARVIHFFTVYFWCVIHAAADGAGAIGAYVSSKRRRGEVPVTPRPRRSPPVFRQNEPTPAGYASTPPIHGRNHRQRPNPATVDTNIAMPQQHYPFNPAISCVPQMPGAYPQLPQPVQDFVPPHDLTLPRWPQVATGAQSSTPLRVATNPPIQQDVALTSAKGRDLRNPFPSNSDPFTLAPVNQDVISELEVISRSIERARRQWKPFKNIRESGRSQHLATSSSKPTGILRKRILSREGISGLSSRISNALAGDRGSPVSPETPIRPKRTVAFAKSPRTGRPVTATKRYIIGESMDYPSPSSSRDESSILSLRSNLSTDPDFHNAAASAQLLGECFPSDAYARVDHVSQAHDETTITDGEVASGSFPAQASEGHGSSSQSQANEVSAAPANHDSTTTSSEIRSNNSPAQAHETHGSMSQPLQQLTDESPALLPNETMILDNECPSGSPPTQADAPQAIESQPPRSSVENPATPSSSSSPSNSNNTPTNDQSPSPAEAVLIRDAVLAEIRESSPESSKDSRNFSRPGIGSGSTHTNSIADGAAPSRYSLPDADVRRSSFESNEDSSRNSSRSADGSRSNPRRSAGLKTEGDDDVFVQRDVQVPRRRSRRQAKVPSKAPSSPRSRGRSGSPDLHAAVGELAISPSNELTNSDRYASKRAEEEAQREAAEQARRAEEEAKRQDQLRKEAEEKAHTMGLRRMPKETPIQPLTAEADAAIEEALRKGQRVQVAMTTTGNPITRRDIGKVLPQSGTPDDPSGWLNDEIISAYLQMVTEYGHGKAAENPRDKPKFHSFNAFFYTNLQNKGYDGVKRWAKKAKIGGKDLEAVEWVFIPVNKGGNHWTLAAVSPMRKLIEYFDSLHGASAQVIRTIKGWLKGELGSAFAEEEWTVREQAGFEGKGGGPSQNNAKDCGVFTATTAKMITLGVDPMAVTAADMPLQRRRMVAEMLNGGFSGAFEPKVEFDEWIV